MVDRNLRDLMADEIEKGECKTGIVDGRQVTIFNVDGQLYATQAECTHRGGPLCEGAFFGEIVTCPWHGSEFNVRTGAVITPPAQEPLKRYKVTVENGKIVLGEMVAENVMRDA